MLEPCGHKLLIKPDDLKTTTDWGLELVIENEKLERAALQTGTLVAIGPDCWKAFRQMEDGKEHNGKPWARLNDKVMYAKYGGAFVVDPGTGEEYVLLNDEDINCVIIEEPENG